SEARDRRWRQAVRRTAAPATRRRGLRSFRRRTRKPPTRRRWVPPCSAGSGAGARTSSSADSAGPPDPRVPGGKGEENRKRPVRPPRRAGPSRARPALSSPGSLESWPAGGAITGGEPKKSSHGGHGGGILIGHLRGRGKAWRLGRFHAHGG